MKRLIINADDFGLSDGVCRSICELLANEGVSSTTVMAAFPGSPELCIKYALSNFRPKVGVHLQVTSGAPIYRCRVNSLVDNSGNFKPKHLMHTIDPTDVKNEWKAQIDLVSELIGGEPSHLDSHHGAHHTRHLAPVLLDLADEYNLPVRDRSAMNEILPHRSVRGSDAVIYTWTAKGKTAEDLTRLIKKTTIEKPDAQSIEVVSHPGYSDKQLRRISSLSDLRLAEHNALNQLRSQEIWSSLGIKLANFSELVSLQP